MSVCEDDGLPTAAGLSPGLQLGILERLGATNAALDVTGMGVQCCLDELRSHLDEIQINIQKNTDPNQTESMMKHSQQADKEHCG